MIRGLKWLKGASYISDADRERVLAVVEECKKAHPEHARTVGIRCPSYIGNPDTIAVVDYGPGRLIYRFVSKSPLPIEARIGEPVPAGRPFCRR